MHAARVQGAVSSFHKTKRLAAAIDVNRSIPSTPNTLHHHHQHQHRYLLSHLSYAMRSKTLSFPTREALESHWAESTVSRYRPTAVSPLLQGKSTFLRFRQSHSITAVMLPMRVGTDGLLRDARGVSLNLCKTVAWVKTHERLTNKQHISGSSQPPLFHSRQKHGTEFLRKQLRLSLQRATRVGHAIPVSTHRDRRPPRRQENYTPTRCARTVKGGRCTLTERRGTEGVAVGDGRTQLSTQILASQLTLRELLYLCDNDDDDDDDGNDHQHNHDHAALPRSNASRAAYCPFDVGVRVSYVVRRRLHLWS